MAIVMALACDGKCSEVPGLFSFLVILIWDGPGKVEEKYLVVKN